MKILLLAAALLAGRIFPAVSFISSPALMKDAQNRFWVEFTVSESTDVAVSVVDPRDSTVIRHLAGGVLGSKAPAPLQSNTLRQRIEWDGKDDLGFAVMNPSTMAARVRVGLGVQLKNLIGDNPYSFTSGLSFAGGGVFGIVAGNDGSVFICGNPGAVYDAHVMLPIKSIRQYDRDGRYLKTVFPFPSNLPLNQVSGWGVNAYPANAYSPVMTNTSMPGYTKTILSFQKDPWGGMMLFQNSQGQLVFGNHYTTVTLGTDGSKPDTTSGVALIKSPALPNRPLQLGTAFMTQIPGQNKILLSGIFAAATSSGHLTAADTVSYYRDGRIYKVDLATGQASVWLDLDTVLALPAQRIPKLLGGEFYSALHGTAIDGKGRVYVCDRYNRRIGIYDGLQDTAARFIGSIPLAAPDRIALGKNGAIYVAARYQQTTASTTGYLRIFKFAPWDSGAAPVCSLTVLTSVTTSPTSAYMAVTDSGTKPRLWIGYVSTCMRIYQDEGASFSLFKDFNAEAKTQNTGYSRLAVDRRNETVYIQDGWWGIYKIESWANPTALPCSTSAGKRLYGTDMSVSPHSFLYVREDAVYGCTGPVSRYTLDHRHAPANWANTSRNILTPVTSGRYGSTSGEHGFAVDGHGTVAHMVAGYNALRNNYSIVFYGDSGNNAQFNDVKLFPLAYQCGGVKFDLQGNLYIGAKTAAPGFTAPPAFATDWAYNRALGTIVKYPAGFDTGFVSATEAKGASKVYALGVAPFSNDNSGGFCICFQPRFDVDPYGRIFAPNAMSREITVVDNEGNGILKFGSYGNQDSRGGLPGPGQTIATPAIPFIYPVGVAVSEDFIYVTDFGNNRLARLAMNYALDNHPEIHPMKVENNSGLALSVQLQARPNPGHSATTLSFSLSEQSRVRLDIFSVAGRYVTTLASDIVRPGQHHFTWNGADLSGRPAAAGRYIARLSTGKKDFLREIILVR